MVKLHEIWFVDDNDDICDLDYSGYDSRVAEETYWSDYKVMMAILEHATIQEMRKEPDVVHFCYAGDMNG